MLVKELFQWLNENFTEDGHIIFSREAHFSTIKHPETGEKCFLIASDSPTDKIDWDCGLNKPLTPNWNRMASLMSSGVLEIPPQPNQSQ